MLSGISGVKAAWFQEPPADKMVYPCILYELDRREADHADNLPYRTAKRYQVTVIDRNGLSSIADAVFSLPQCSFDRRFKANSLYHDVFNIYF